MSLESIQQMFTALSHQDLAILAAVSAVLVQYFVHSVLKLKEATKVKWALSFALPLVTSWALATLADTSLSGGWEYLLAQGVYFVCEQLKNAVRVDAPVVSVDTVTEVPQLQEGV